MTATLRLFLAGDVMLGRGIDQILPHPGAPDLYESYVNSALSYVDLAERHCGPIPRAVPAGYVWGELPSTLAARSCDLRFVNLETAITTADRAEPKGINYRMHPANAAVLTAGGIDGCSLANNHVMDWGREGLVETLETLARTGIPQAGAGTTAQQAAAPLVLDVPGKGRVLVIAYGARSSGVPADWAAGPQTPGINLLPDSVDDLVARTRQSLAPLRHGGDVVVVSVHWGGNWGYAVTPEHRAMAHALIDECGVDIVHGHSSHHPRAVEVYHGKPILYGCGDLINDYEGIGGYEAFRSDLVLGYVIDISVGDGSLRALSMLPFRTRAFRLQHADAAEAAWLADVMDRECRACGGRVTVTARRELSLSWQDTAAPG